MRQICFEIQDHVGLSDLREEIKAAQDILDRRAGEKNFEVLLSDLTRDERSKLNRLLLITFCDISLRPRMPDLLECDFGFRFKTDGYDKLLKVLNFSTIGWSVVSLNYDLLLEEAIQRNGLEFFYPHFPFFFGEEQKMMSGIKVYKPHGSINFFAQPDHKIYHREPRPTDPRGMPVEYFKGEDGRVTPTFPIVMAAQPGSENVLHIANSSRVGEPVIASYTKGKPADVNQETLEKVRQDAIRAISYADEIVLIGVKPIRDATDDSFVTSALSSFSKELTYISASAEDCRQVSEWFPEAKIFTKGLGEFLDGYKPVQ